MAYVLGFFCADGTMIDDKISRGKYIRFINTDKQILEDIRNAMISTHSIYTTKATTSRKAKHVLSIGSKKLFSSLGALGLTINKSLSIKTPAVPAQYINDFIRGYFDGDGCIHIEKKHRTLRLIFTSGSEIFLSELTKMISTSTGIGLKNVLGSRRSFQLKYSQNDAIALLSSIYKDASSGLYLERKRLIFDRYMDNK